MRSLAVTITALTTISLILVPVVIAKAASNIGAWETSAELGDEIPATILAVCQAADEQRPELVWQLVAGIGSVEPAHGTSNGSAVDHESGKMVSLRTPRPDQPTGPPARRTSTSI